MSTPEPGPVPSPPVLRIIRGDATPEEIAAVVAVLSAASGAAPAEAEPVARSRWAAPQLRQPLHPSPGAWAAYYR